MQFPPLKFLNRVHIVGYRVRHHLDMRFVQKLGRN